MGGGSRARGDAFLDVFVELTLLSRAACLLTSHSGFSLTALWMSDNPGLAACHRVSGGEDEGGVGQELREGWEMRVRPLPGSERVVGDVATRRGLRQRSVIGQSMPASCTHRLHVPQHPCTCMLPLCYTFNGL